MEIKRYETNKRTSKAVIYNNTVYLCGQVAKLEDAKKGMKEQTISTLKNVEEILEANGTSKEKILSATIYIKDMAMFQEMNGVWDNWIAEGFAPARACVEAKMAREELLFEISVVAAV